MRIPMLRMMRRTLLVTMAAFVLGLLARAEEIKEVELEVRGMT
jgi:hypothetical protein